MNHYSTAGLRVDSRGKSQVSSFLPNPKAPSRYESGRVPGSAARQMLHAPGQYSNIEPVASWQCQRGSAAYDSATRRTGSGSSSEGAPMGFSIRASSRYGATRGNRCSKPYGPAGPTISSDFCCLSSVGPAAGVAGETGPTQSSRARSR